MTTYTSPTPITWEHNNSSYTKEYKKSSVTIGVLALQGDFLEHIQTLNTLGIATKEVRLPADLDVINAIILPGGESTTMANLLDVFHLRLPLKQKIAQGMPVWGTCAGMILLAQKLIQATPEPLGIMAITVNRNAFGRQRESFSEAIQITPLGDVPMHATFIRAPFITAIGNEVTVLATLQDGTIVAAQQADMLVTAFHPELTKDTRLHNYFVQIAEKGNL